MGFVVDDYIKEVSQALMKKSNSQYAEKQKDYMKGNFEFLGIKSQPRRKATRFFMRKAERPDYNQINIVVKKFWKLPEREYQYFAMELLEKYKKQYNKDVISLFQYIITTKSWWDTVDFISKKIVGRYFELYPELIDEYVSKWIASEDIWLQRTCLLFQLGYKENTDLILLFDIVDNLKDKDEFFIQKAIGWALREYSKIEPNKIEKFVKEKNLSSLSEREAMKWIEK